MSESKSVESRPAPSDGVERGILPVLVFVTLAGIAGLSFAFAGLLAHPTSLAVQKASTPPGPSVKNG
jgi:hypothetical protein